MHGPSMDRVSFDETTAALLAAFADTLIPRGQGFPPPSAIRIVEDFMTRYVAPDTATPLYAPAVTLSDVSTLVSALGAGFAAASEADRASAVGELEGAEPELFARLQALVYAGYYSRPETRTAIANTIDAGRDWRGAPQPYGYLDVIEPWDTSLISTRGSYVKTEDVRPIDPEALAALRAALAADQNGSAA